MPLVIPKSKGIAKQAKPTKTFEVRPSSVAVLSRLTSTPGAARLLHGLLELWVDTARKVRRVHEGKPLDFLFLSAADLNELTGMSEKQLERGFADLKLNPHVLVLTRRLRPQDANRRAIHLDQASIWDEVNTMLDATKKVLVDHGSGTKTYEYQVDRKVLTHLFKRLYDGVTGDG